MCARARIGPSLASHTAAQRRPLAPGTERCAPHHPQGPKRPESIHGVASIVRPRIASPASATALPVLGQLLNASRPSSLPITPPAASHRRATVTRSLSSGRTPASTQFSPHSSPWSAGNSKRQDRAQARESSRPARLPHLVPQPPCVAQHCPRQCLGRNMGSVGEVCMPLPSLPTSTTTLLER